MPIKEIKHFLKKYLMLNELKEIEIASEDERFCTIDGMLYSKDNAGFISARVEEKVCW